MVFQSGKSEDIQQTFEVISLNNKVVARGGLTVEVNSISANSPNTYKILLYVALERPSTVLISDSTNNSLAYHFLL